VARNLTVNAALAFTLPTIEKWANGPCYGDSDQRGGERHQAGRQRFDRRPELGLLPDRAGFDHWSAEPGHSVFPGTPKIKLNVGANYD
jgi:iron complex outermembrane receptor protein